jgi:hypothetical protein
MKVPIKQVDDLIILINGQNVILDSDIAALYGTETREINKAVKNNPDKFPAGYIIKANKSELVENFHRFSSLKHSSATPKAFTEKGLYMLATILKSKRATDTTISIIEAFAKLRELSRAVSALAETKDAPTQKSLMQKSGEIMADLLDSGLKTSGTETCLEINLAVMKFKHTVKREKK